MKIKFINAQVLDLEKEPYLQTKQVLVENQKIIAVAEKIETQADRVIDVDNNILMSGFVNAHAHNVMSLLRGIKSDVNLQTWLFDYVFKAEKNLTKEDAYWGETLGIMESIKSGITCFEENYFYFPSVVKAVKNCFVRARVGIGREKQSKGITNDLQNALKLFDNQNMIKAVVYPHSIYTVEEKELEEFASFAKQNNLPLATHLSETLEEVGECTTKHGDKSPVEYLEDIGFFDRFCTLYHCVHVDKDDTKILSDYKVNVVTCPSSNLKLASGIAPLHTFLENNINIAIGTDGPASNDSIDMFKEMFLAATLQKANLFDPTVMPVNQILKMATENGAKALGFEKIGKIKPDYFADLILVDTKGLHHVPQNNLVSNLVFSAKSTDVYLTMVNGKILYENGKFYLTEKVEDVVNNCQKIAERLLK